MLNQANLPIAFWGQAVLYLTCILNVTPSSSISETTSYEVWKKRKPNLNRYRVFGCRAFVHIQKKDRGPLESRTRKCIFIGFNDGYKGWKVYDPATQKVSISRDVIFDETSFPGTSAAPSERLTDTLPPRELWVDKGDNGDMIAPAENCDLPPPPTSGPDAPGYDPSRENSPTFPDGPPTDMPPDLNEQAPMVPPSTREPVTANSPDVPPHHTEPLIAQGNRPICSGRVLDYGTLDGRTRRMTRPIAHWQRAPETTEVDDLVPYIQESQHSAEQRESALRVGHSTEPNDCIHTENGRYMTISDAFEIAFEMAAKKAYGASVHPEDSPSGWKDAMSHPDRDRWFQAAEAEIGALLANGTWELVELPPGRRAISSRWVFLVKRHADGTIDCYKAHLVACGDNQRPGIDYDQVFAPTARLGALRSVLALAALAGEHIESVDISNAYLNGELEKEYEVYMRQLEGVGDPCYV